MVDFNPDFSIEEPIKANKPEKSTQVVYNTESELILSGTSNQNIVTVNNLLGLTKSHIDDDNECREIINQVTDELVNSIHLMSVKELLEFLKIKIREREFHVQCIFKAYDFINKSEYAREAFIGNNRKERIIEATDRTKITNLLTILNS